MEQRMKEARNKRGYSMIKVAELIGISDSAYSKLERGINNPAPRTVELFCQKLHISESWLRTGEGEMEERELFTDLVAQYNLGPAGQALLRAVARAFAELDEETCARVLDETFRELQLAIAARDAGNPATVPTVNPQSPADSSSSVS